MRWTGNLYSVSVLTTGHGYLELVMDRDGCDGWFRDTYELYRKGMAKSIGVRFLLR